MRKRAAPKLLAVVLGIGFLAGLILRLAMVSQMGVSDMDAYHRWGNRALDADLPSTYRGIYFPLQYQVFEVGAWLARGLGVPFVPVFKTANLVFDAGAFLLLLLLLRRLGNSPAYALLYWLHPWSLAMFSLGYVDVQFTFFVLLCAYAAKGTSATRYLLAGIPLGIAFLMKPQAQILFIAVSLYGAFRYVRTRDARALAMLVFPAVLFLAYEIYFTAALLPRHGWYLPARILPHSYLNVTNIMPCLTAQLPNIWYPIAYVLKQPQDQIFAVSDRIHVLPFLRLKYAAAAVAVALVAWHVSRTERATRTTAAGDGASSVTSDAVVAMFGFASLVVPFVMTSAHENHLFLGGLFLILFLARDRSLGFRLAAHLLLAIQFLNLYGLYGEHPASIARALRDTYSQELALGYSLVSVSCFVLILWRLLSGREQVEGWREAGPDGHRAAAHAGPSRPEGGYRGPHKSGGSVGLTLSGEATLATGPDKKAAPENETQQSS